MVGVGLRLAAPGEVLGTTEDALTALPPVKGASVVDYLLVSFAPAAAIEGVLSLGMMIDIKDRSEVEVDPEHGEHLAGSPSNLCDDPGVSLDPQLSCGRRRGKKRRGAPHTTSFIINADEGGVVAQLTKGVSKLSGLERANQISCEEDKAPGLHIAEKREFLRSELRSRESEEETLAGSHGGCREPEKR